MVSVASQLIEEVTAHAQRDSLEVAREICAGGAFFLNNLHRYILHLATLLVGHDMIHMSYFCPTIVVKV